jgi:hypothetical protein
MTAEIRDRKVSSNDSETDQTGSPVATVAGQQFLQGERLEVKVRESIVLVILSHEPADWSVNIIAVMGDVVDAILADRTLGGAASDRVPTSFIPGEIKIQRIIILWRRNQVRSNHVF